MKPAVEITIEAGDWAGLAGAESAVKRAVRAALGEASGAEEIGVVLTDDAHMRALNRRWRKKDKPTNVLSFPAPDGKAGGFLGDVVFALETVLREAAAEDKPPLHHLSHLAVHGSLHLLGFDHERNADAERMESRERKILRDLGIPDPYAPARKRDKVRA